MTHNDLEYEKNFGLNAFWHCSLILDVHHAISNAHISDREKNEIPISFIGLVAILMDAETVWSLLVSK